jgi:hypothetical protein
MQVKGGSKKVNNLRFNCTFETVVIQLRLLHLIHNLTKTIIDETKQ